MGISREGRPPVEVSVVIPTYRERENILPLCMGLEAVLRPVCPFEILVVDDNSPDGTGQVVEEFARDHPWVRVIHRPGRLGLASAVLEGFRRARGRIWVMMDGDGSHRPEDVPSLLAALEGAEVAVGSRYVAGGGTEGWPRWRKVVSRVANSLGRWALGMPIRDVTSGFAAFRSECVLQALDTLHPQGFKLLLPLLARLPRARVVEVPILFRNRNAGRSKFGPREVWLFLRLCLQVRLAKGRP